ncbi:uncharacterized protein LOC125772311 isoform X1 [Anopheles funestus]|uniref:uncharacterized protein LOC125772311 isoform X1 n=1 Tax=Anopheles funestus TaxID=62324 RepID=UPI0020C6047B|nr:uncharacterized protein LOC125772311 isoform X1 [Anopheles funestus]
MENFVLLLIVFTAMTAGQTTDKPIFPVEACGNRTACTSATYMEQSHEFCKDYGGRVTVPSKLCLNGVILCDNYSRAGACFYPPSNLLSNCEIAIENCFSYMSSTSTPKTTISDYEVTTSESLEESIFPVEVCGNRTACTSSRYMEQSHEFCKDYGGRVAVPSKQCLNGVILCDNYSRAGACFYPPSNLLSNCEIAIENCFSYMSSTSTPKTTTTDYEVTTSESLEESIFPVEACGNRTACTSSRYMEQSHEFCKDYGGRVTVPSKLCLNGVILCDNYSRAGACFYPPSNLLSNCEIAIENCFSYMSSTSTPKTTTTDYEVTTSESLEESIFPVEACGNRTACTSSRYMEQSHEFCKDYGGRVTVPSKLCLNGVILCDNYSRAGACFYPPSNLLSNCEIAIENCFSYMRSTSTPRTTISDYEVTTSESLEESIFPVEACGNRTACTSATYMEQSHEFCKDYGGRVAVPSKLCLNGVILCDNYSRAGACFYPPSNLLSNCEIAIENCFSYMSSTSTPSITTTDYEVATTESLEENIFPLEACDNRTACLHIPLEEIKGFCKDYAGEVAVRSKLCVNAMILCKNHRFAQGCLFPSDILATFGCDIAVERCYPKYTTTGPEATTTAIVTTTTTTTTEKTTIAQSISEGPKAGEPCMYAGKRTAMVDSCVTYLECSGEYYNERSCSNGYIFYQPFGFCLPGDVKQCQLYTS